MRLVAHPGGRAWSRRRTSYPSGSVPVFFRMQFTLKYSKPMDPTLMALGAVKVRSTTAAAGAAAARSRRVVSEQKRREAGAVAGIGGVLRESPEEFYTMRAGSAQGEGMADEFDLEA